MSTTTKRAVKPRPRGPRVRPETRERIEEKVREAEAEVSERSASALSAFGLELAKVLAHPDEGVMMGEQNIDVGGQQGITIEEIGELLLAREQKGHALGYERASQDGRRDLRLALQRERAESVAGALLFCVEQLAPVLDQFADVDRNQIGDAAARASFVAARLGLIELAAAMSRHAQQIAGGEQPLAGTGTNTNTTYAQGVTSRY